MTGKFTKGPWKARYDSQLQALIEIYNEDRIIVAVLPDRGTVEAMSEIEANANLIAAAPDMYEALEAYEKAEADIVLNANWYTESGVPQITQEQFDMLIDCQTLRNKALRKARGEGE